MLLQVITQLNFSFFFSLFSLHLFCFFLLYFFFFLFYLSLYSPFDPTVTNYLNGLSKSNSRTLSPHPIKCYTIVDYFRAPKTFYLILQGFNLYFRLLEYGAIQQPHGSVVFCLLGSGPNEALLTRALIATQGLNHKSSVPSLYVGLSK